MSRSLRYSPGDVARYSAPMLTFSRDWTLRHLPGSPTRSAATLILVAGLWSLYRVIPKKKRSERTKRRRIDRSLGETWVSRVEAFHDAKSFSKLQG